MPTMNEVEKMYDNAGITKEKKKMLDIETGDTVLTLDSFYPEFTAEKQIELIKFMLHKGVYYDTDGDTYWFHYTNEIENVTYRPFEEAIAEFINGFWQYLTEKERKQIKEILE